MEEPEEQESRHGSFALGAVGSLVGALVGAVIWCIVALAANVELGWIAWGLGGLAGVGMAIGYRRRSVAAGVTAALIAVLGIVGAKAMIVGYSAREHLAEFQRSLEVYDLPAKTVEKIQKLAMRKAHREAKKLGSCPYDDRYWEWYSEAFLEYGTLSEQELGEALADYEIWEEERWADPQYVYDTLVYGLVYEVHPGVWYVREPLAEEEWVDIYQTARERADGLSPEERLRECRRREWRALLANHRATRRARERHLAKGDHAAWLELVEEEYAGTDGMDDEALRAAGESAKDWDEVGRWDDPAWLRQELTYYLADRAWHEREGKPIDERPVPGTTWDQCHNEAAEEAEAVSDAELAARVRHEEAVHEEWFAREQQERKREAQLAVAAGMLGAIGSEMFSVYDLLFGGLAVVTAYRLGAGKREEEVAAETEAEP